MPCPRPCCPQLWAHSRLAAALSTHSLPHSGRTDLTMTHTMHVDRIQAPRVHLLKSLSTFKFSTLLNLSSQFKDLNKTNQSMIHGLRAGHDFVSMHCRQCQAQFVLTHKHIQMVQLIHMQHKHPPGMAGTGWVWKGFGARHAEDHRKCSHCGDCHISATSRVGTQQAHSLNERKRNFSEQTL